MTLPLKPGTRLFSTVCSTELIVVKAAGTPVDVTIGGAVPVLASADRSGDGAVVPEFGGGAAMGKRYVDAEGAIELLCTKPGDGLPAVNGVLLHIKDAKAMPASD
ncbi:hypothetical protein BH10ACT2_BH10ACT2_15870 [soil metagenome]